MALPFGSWSLPLLCPFLPAPPLSAPLCWANGPYSVSFCTPVMLLFNLPVFSALLSDCCVLSLNQCSRTSFFLTAYCLPDLVCPWSLSLPKPCWQNTWLTVFESILNPWCWRGGLMLMWKGESPIYWRGDFVTKSSDCSGRPLLLEIDHRLTSLIS